MKGDSHHQNKFREKNNHDKFVTIGQKIQKIVNNKISFIDNPYLFFATRFVCNYTHYKAISVTIFS